MIAVIVVGCQGEASPPFGRLGAFVGGYLIVCVCEESSKQTDSDEIARKMEQSNTKIGNTNEKETRKRGKEKEMKETSKLLVSGTRRREKRDLRCKGQASESLPYAFHHHIGYVVLKFPIKK